MTIGRTVLAQARLLRLFPTQEARKGLLEKARQQNLLEAVRISSLSGSPYLLEALRNDLIQEHSKLVESGKIEAQ
jgi:hypothetical protein